MRCSKTYPQVVGHHTVEEVDIVLAQSAQVEELVDGGVLQAQLGKAAGLLGLVALGARRGETVGAQVLADVGRVGGIIIGISVVYGLARMTRDGEALRVSHIRGSVGVVHEGGRMDRPALCGRKSSHCVRRRAQLSRRGGMIERRETGADVFMYRYQASPPLDRSCAHHGHSEAQRKLTGTAWGGSKS